MRTLYIVAAFVVVGMAIVSGRQAHEGAAEDSEKMLVHGVYFTLKDNSDQAKQEFIGLCEKYLTGHDGTNYFGVGDRAEEYNREVNDQDYDIGLYIVFENKAAHDKYQDHPRHQEFIKNASDKWSKVRVFDSYLAVTSG